MRPRDRRIRTIRTIGGHGAARFVAALALLVNLLVHLSPLWVPAAERGGIEICTAYGLAVVPEPSADPAGQPDEDQRVKFCPVCAVHAAAMLVPPAAPLPLSPDAPLAFLPSAGDGLFAALAAGFDHQSRAPPRLS